MKPSATPSNHPRRHPHHQHDAQEDRHADGDVVAEGGGVVGDSFYASIPISEFTLSGRQAYPEVVKPIYDEINEIYGTDFKPGL